LKRSENGVIVTKKGILNLKRSLQNKVGLGLALVAGVLLTAPAAKAQSYPTRPISMIAPFPAGSATDTVARLIGEKMSAKLGQPILVENVPGAGGTIAAARLARAEPDGYTLMIHTTIALSAALYKNLPYDTGTAFDTIGMINTGPYVFAARPVYPAKDAKELIANLKKDGNKIAFANAGPGTGSHLCAVVLSQTLGIQPNLVPYKSTSLALQDVIAGHVDILCDQTTNAFPQIASKTVKGYAITSPKRNARFPDIPTTAELGLPQVDVEVWHGLYAPKGTPAPILDTLNAALRVALDDPSVQKKLVDMGTDLFPAEQRSREAHGKKLADDLIKLRDVVEKAQIKIN
jgi:tripartite-type tricarboxylate transporter receptor subunit TctC